MSDIEFKLDEHNDVTFEVDIRGSEKATSSPIIRFVCESGDITYGFKGEYTGNGEVSFEIPPLKGKVEEGRAKGKLEVILEDKYFVPIEFGIDFVAPTEVVAEIKTKKKKGTKTLQESPREPVSAQIVVKPKSIRARKGTLASRYKKD
jgi:hypothetical protein